MSESISGQGSNTTDASGMTPRPPGEMLGLSFTPRDPDGLQAPSPSIVTNISGSNLDTSNPWKRERLPGISERSECSMSDVNFSGGRHAASSTSPAVPRVLLDRQAVLPAIHARGHPGVGGGAKELHVGGGIRGGKVHKTAREQHMIRAHSSRERMAALQSKSAEDLGFDPRRGKENVQNTPVEREVTIIDDYSQRNHAMHLKKQKQLAEQRIRPVNENIRKALHHEKVYMGKFKRSATTLNLIHERPALETLMAVDEEFRADSSVSDDTSNSDSKVAKRDASPVKSSRVQVTGSQSDKNKKAPVVDNCAVISKTSTGQEKHQTKNESVRPSTIGVSTSLQTVPTKSSSRSPTHTIIKAPALFRSHTTFASMQMARSSQSLQKRVSTHLHKAYHHRHLTAPPEMNVTVTCSSDGESPRGGGGIGITGSSHVTPRSPKDHVVGMRTTPRNLRTRARKQSVMPGGVPVLGGGVGADDSSSTPLLMTGVRIRWTLPGQAFSFFKMAAWKIKVVLQWWHMLLGKSKQVEGEMMTFLDIARQVEETSHRQQMKQQSGGVVFDPSEYKTSKDREIKLASDVKSFLTLPKEYRDHSQLQKVLHGLEVVKSFSEYPLHMQEKLAKVAWYQEYPPKKIILKQGHYAENFYFILSGVALVKIIMTSKSTGLPSMNVVARLGGGQSFGEVALLHHSQRTATIESESTTHMLVISRGDFFDIFFNAKDGHEPEYISFCREIDFLRHWPVDILLCTPGMCMFHYFKRGSTVIGDSTKNEWIYIVKSGTCNVVKRLRAVEAERVWDQRLTPSDRLRLPVMELPSTDIGARINSNFTARPLPRENSGLRRVMTSFLHERRNKDETESMEQEDEEDSEEDSEHRPMGEKQKSSVSFRLPEPEEEEQEEEEEGVNGREKRAGLRGQSSHSNKRNATTTTMQDTRKARSANGDVIKRVVPPNSKMNNFTQQSTAHLKSGVPHHGRGAPKPHRSSSKPRINATFANQPCFVLLKSLKPKDVFGLEDVKFADEEDSPTTSGKSGTSVSVVSNGAELIMLSRAFFQQHAEVKTKQFIREHVWPFPTEDTMQANLQDEVNWSLFRKEMIADTIHRQELERSIVVT